MNLSKRLLFFGLMSFLLTFNVIVPSASAEYEGSWKGQYAGFDVSGGQVHELTLRMCPYGDCEQGFDWYFVDDLSISGNQFSYDGPTSHLTGTFTSSTTCSIAWEYGDAIYSGSGTYTENLVFIAFSPWNHDFGEQIAGTESDTSLFELKNITSSTVNGSIYLTGTDADQFEIVSEGGSFSLAPDQTRIVSVRFVPSSTGEKKASLKADLTQPVVIANYAYLSGTGTSPTLSVTPDFRYVSANSGSTSFTVANTGSGTMAWSATSDQADTWITITSGSSGTNSGTIVVAYEANTGPDRTAILTVEVPGAINSPKYIEVRQGSPTLSVTPDHQDVFANSGTVQFTIDNVSGGTMNWTVSTESPWITNIEPSSGTNNGIITVTYEANDGHERMGTITVVAAGAANSTKTLELSQLSSIWKLLAGDGAELDCFGSSADISGDYAIVGAYLDDDKGNNSGSAYIFKRIGIDWVQQAKLTASDGAEDDFFGRAVAISGNCAIVGADGGGVNEGAAYVFEMPPDGWADMTQTAKLTASSLSESWYVSPAFGSSVDISGDSVVVGAPGDAGGKGSVFIFEKPGSGWTAMTQTAKLTAADGYGKFQDTDSFGRSVGISGDYVIVGAPGDDDSGSSSGSAYLFEKPLAGWTNMNQTAKLTAGDGATSDYLGYSVGISADYAIVGAYGDDDRGSSSGSAYIFKKPVEGWTNMNQTAKLTADDGAADDRFGYSVGISENYVVVGAYYDDNNGNNSGSAYIFEKPLSGWTNMNQTAKLTASDGAADDYLGYSVGISENTAIVGAYSDNDKGTDSGSVYIYAIDTDNDGLRDIIESNYCTDPNNSDSDKDDIIDGAEDKNHNGVVDIGETDPCDADTDDDGILDGEEDANHNGVVDAGETDPCNSDTDSDGLQDGTEIGLTDGHPTDTDPAFFQPDLDPSTKTNPLNADTDNDGLTDGEEDLNHNGMVDEGETDPNTIRPMPWLPLLLGD